MGNDGKQSYVTKFYNLEFLNKNKCLIRNNELVISNNTLVAITLLTAESRPEEKEIIINVIMHLLSENK